MVIQYPRTCDACGTIYSLKQNYSRHLREGRCQRKQAPQSFGQSLCGQHITNIETQNITNHNAVPVVSQNERLLQERIKELEIQSQHQQKAFQALLNNDPLPLLGADDQYIYVLQKRHAMELLSVGPVYRVGVTDTIHQRVSEYPRGSKLLFCRVYKNGRKREASLHQHLRTKFKQRADFGIEGNINEIIDQIIDFMRNTENVSNTAATGESESDIDLSDSDVEFSGSVRKAIVHRT